MADTQRTLTAIKALLADNTAGDISPQDLRDVVETFTPPYGSYYLSSAAETSVSIAGTYVKVAGTTAANNLRDFTHSSGRLTYTGTVAQHFHLASTISFTAAGNNKLIAFKLAKNGTVVDGSYTPRFVSTGADVGSLALHWDEMLDPNDYLEIWGTNETDTTNFTAQALYLFALGMVV